MESKDSARATARTLGKRSFESGVPLAEVIDTAMGSFATAARSADGPAQVARILSAGMSFVLDCVSSYDDALSNASETRRGLRAQADNMEEQARRIAHEIHDSSAQYLASIHTELQRAAAGAPVELVPRLQRAQSLLSQVEADLRRVSQELRPTILDDLGLVSALHELSRSVSQHNGLVVVVEGPADERYAPSVEIALYRTVQEVLANVMGRQRHMHRVKVKIEVRENEIRCSIADDGGGLSGRSSASPRGPGLIGIRERLAALGGTLSIDNRPDGHGTLLTASIPLEVSHVTSRSSR
jgi:signal transduction histidine kinase